MTARTFPTLFLDRDGTINVDLIGNYISHPQQIELIPGSGQAIVRAKRAGFKISVITNQAGVAKGITPQHALPLIHKKMEFLIAKESGFKNFKFDDIRVCPHLADSMCGCRKPEIKMLQESMKKLHSDPNDSFFIGDKISDLLCGKNAGLSVILVRTGYGEKTKTELNGVNPIAIVEDLSRAIAWILESHSKVSSF